MDSLCMDLYGADVPDRLRTRAMLCNIYHHALHDNWYKARDLMLMSHLQETIMISDVPTNVCFELLILVPCFFYFLCYLVYFHVAHSYRVLFLILVYSYGVYPCVFS